MHLLPFEMSLSRRRFLGSALILSSNSALSVAPAKSVSPTLVTSLAQLQSAIDSARSGDVIYLKNGTYRNNKLYVRTDGISVQAETPGGVFLNGSNQLKISGNRVVFRGFQFTEGEAPGTAIEVSGSDNLLSELNFSGYAGKKCINVMAGSQRNEIAYCNFENKPISAPQGNMIEITPDRAILGQHRIRYCSFRNMPGRGGDAGNEPIRLGNGVLSSFKAGTLIEYCYWENTGGGDSESISVKCRHNVIRYCTFTNNPDGMLVFRNGDENMAYSNFFIRAGGIRIKQANSIYCFNNYFDNAGLDGRAGSVTLEYLGNNLNNLNFLHNTFVDSAAVDLGGVGAQNNVWANNVFVKAKGPLLANMNKGTQWLGNAYQGDLGLSNTFGFTLLDATWQRPVGGLAAWQDKLARLPSAQGGYPDLPQWLEAGNDALLELDIAGRSRPAARTGKTIGCLQASSAALQLRPLTSTQAGPSYLVKQ
jgi:hypothetical protein